MKKLMILLMAALMVFTLAPLAGCGGGDEAAEEVQVAKHDCEGGCGMKDMPKDQLTEIEGKQYCAGCAAKIKAGDHDHSGHDHDGHSH